jgi:hypothetical protein
MLKDNVDVDTIEPSSLGERFAYYSRRVRTLYSEDWDENNIYLGSPEPEPREVDVRVYSLWTRLCSPLFPRLRAFHVRDLHLATSQTHEDVFCTFLQAAALTELMLYVTDEPMELFEDYEEELLECSKRLEVMEIHEEGRGLNHSEGRYDWSTLLADMVPNTTCLRTLHLTILIHYSGLTELATLSTLQELYILDVLGVPESGRYFPSNAFSGLVAFRICDFTPSTRFTQNLLALCSSKTLNNVSLSLYADITMGDVQNILTYTGRYVEVERFRVEVPHVRDCMQCARSWELIGNAMQPLPRLKVLNLVIPITPGLESWLVVKALQLYPCLESWYLSDHEGFINNQPGSPISLAAILCLLHTRPAIMTLPIIIPTRHNRIHQSSCRSRERASGIQAASQAGHRSRCGGWCVAWYMEPPHAEIHVDLSHHASFLVTMLIESAPYGVSVPCLVYDFHASAQRSVVYDKYAMRYRYDAD